jgi:hypothetical protein
LQETFLSGNFLLSADLGIESPEVLDLGAGDLGVLHQDEGGRNERALPDIVDWVVGHWFDQSDGLLRPGAGTVNAKSHGSAIPAKECLKLKKL